MYSAFRGGFLTCPNANLRPSSFKEDEEVQEVGEEERMKESRLAKNFLPTLYYIFRAACVVCSIAFYDQFTFPTLTEIPVHWQRRILYYYTSLATTAAV